jgi:hypothetical protein
MALGKSRWSPAVAAVDGTHAMELRPEFRPIWPAKEARETRPPRIGQQSVLFSAQLQTRQPDALGVVFGVENSRFFESIIMTRDHACVLAAITSSAIGGVAGGATRFVIHATDPVTLGVFRFGTGFLILLPIAFIIKSRCHEGATRCLLRLSGRSLLARGLVLT